jgi:Cu+-exporting ATPase
VQWQTASGAAETDLLGWAAAVESHSEHPLARAVVQGALDRGIDAVSAEDVESVVGSGIRGRVDGADVAVGKPEWIASLVGEIPAPSRADIEAGRQQGRTVLAVSRGGRFAGWLAVADTLRETAAAAVAELRAMGLKPLLMLSGDNALVAAHLAQQLQLEYQANLQPGDKLVILKGLVERPTPTGMIGDGTNDAPALATATMSRWKPPTSF